MTDDTAASAPAEAARLGEDRLAEIRALLQDRDYRDRLQIAAESWTMVRQLIAHISLLGADLDTARRWSAAYHATARRYRMMLGVHRERIHRAAQERDAARAEAAALREAIGQACEAVAWLLEEDWPKTSDPAPGGEGIRTRLARWQRLLAACTDAGAGREGGET